VCQRPNRFGKPRHLQPGSATYSTTFGTCRSLTRPESRPRQKRKRIIADRAYDSDPLRERLAKRGIDLIVPYRKNSKHRRYEDGRKLRRYKRRWIIERTNAWLGQVSQTPRAPRASPRHLSSLLLSRLSLDHPQTVFLKTHSNNFLTEDWERRLNRNLGGRIRAILVR
jgi:transposase